MIKVELSRDKAEYILELLEKDASTDDPRADQLIEWFKTWLGIIKEAP